MVALSDENVFAALWPSILLAGPKSNRVQQFWDGGGNFIPTQILPLETLSFTVILSQRQFDELHPLLEEPPIV